MFILNFALAAKGIPHVDANVNETAQPVSINADHWEPQLNLSTVRNCSAGLPCSTFVHAHVQKTTKVRIFSIECYHPAHSTHKQKSWKCSRRKRRKMRMRMFDEEGNCKKTYDCIKILHRQTVLVTVKTCYNQFPEGALERWCKVEDKEGQILRNALLDPYALVPAVTSAPPYDKDKFKGFIVSVDEPSRILKVSIPPGPSMKTRLCYKQPYECTELEPSVFHLIDSSNSLSVNMSFPFLLPCLCVEVYPTGIDAVRTKHCPFENKTLAGNRDIWLSSLIEMREETLLLEPVCHSSSLMPSAALCWQVLENPLVCHPVPNSSLPVKDWRYNISTVDKHSQMCVQFSLNGTSDVRCPFQRGLSEWQAVVLPAPWHFHIRLTSSIPASFSAQLCVLQGEWCVAKGTVHSVKTGNSTEAELWLPFGTLSPGLCVQVWRSAPFLTGRRLLCPQSSHRRWGLVAVASVVLVAFMMTLTCLTYYTVRRGLSAWQLGQKPVLLVCSSEQMSQVSAVCALASLLQGELCAAVRMALWAQSTGGVTKLGPLPWLYGQCEAVRAAGGRVLIAWSPEASDTYWCWKKDGGKEEMAGEKKNKEEKQRDSRNNDAVGEKGTKVHWGKTSGQSRSDGLQQPSSATVPILRAALACLQGELQEGREGLGFALVYFQGLSQSHHIPLELRGVPQYCLPRDFGGLLWELQGGAVGGRRRNRCSCWAALFSKILALRLAQRLRMWLPQIRPLEEEVKV
ncbi:hypothetical protein GJAV_G00186310 [Gymnothorax javanicus]|nr:hypothetical protein GJAV_G00186310 [Gymnothorax javanicus]